MAEDCSLTVGTRFYRLSARAIAPILRLEFVRSIFIRRSVAVGEAVFPWSDLDLGIVIDRSSGDNLCRLWRRFQAASILFPRLGQCEIFTSPELAELAASDPYRASLERRFCITVAGQAPSIPAAPISSRDAARRLIIWFSHYLPRTVRQRRRRDQRKIVLEMYNALGVLKGAWPEPLATRLETEGAVEAAGLDAVAQDAADPFAVCCRIAARACSGQFADVPKVRETTVLDGPAPLVILPDETTPWPPFALQSPAVVATPIVLQCLLEGHEPFLWLWHGEALRQLGFTAPSALSWAESCIWYARGDQVRGPGFRAKTPQAIHANLQLIEHVISRLERGDEVAGPVDLPSSNPGTSVIGFYRNDYDELAQTGRTLHQRAASLLKRGDSAT